MALPGAIGSPGSLHDREGHSGAEKSRDIQCPPRVTAGQLSPEETGSHAPKSPGGCKEGAPCFTRGETKAQRGDLPCIPP